MTELGIPPQTAEIVSCSLSGFDTVCHLIKSYHTQEQYFRKLKNIFSPDYNLMPFRRSGGIASFINAALFSLLNLVVELKIFDDSGITSQIAHLVPATLMDLIHYDSIQMILSLIVLLSGNQ